MAPIIFRYSAVAVLVGASAVAVMLLGSDRGLDPRSSQAQSSAAENPANQTVRNNGVVKVTAVQPTVEDLHRVTRQPAHVEAYERTDIYAKASGYISKVAVDIGDRVEKDQILAELWIPEMEQEEQQKQALVEQARAAVEQSQARLDSADALIAAAQAEAAESRAAVEQHKAEVAFRRSEHRRMTELVASRSVNESIQDEKLKQLQSAESALSAAQAKVKSAEAAVQVEQARKLQARADVLHAQSRLKVAEANLKESRILMQYARIRAPYAGLITMRWADSGDFVASASESKSEPLFTVDRVETLRIIFDIPESESAMVHVGQPASLVVDALKGREFLGKVARTAGVLDRNTRTLRVEAELDEPDSALRPGMFGMISVTLAERPRTVMLPARCIRYEQKQPFVLCVNQGVVEKHPVKLGYTDGTQMEILEGIGANDSVVLESRFPVRPGAAVQIAASE